MRRIPAPIAIGAIACAAAAAAGSALGDVRIEVLQPTVIGAIGDGAADHVRIVRDGFDGTLSVGQQGFGDPSIRPSSISGGGCSLDFLGNVVTCGGSPSEVVLVMGDGADRVAFANGLTQSCVASPGAATTATVQLEGGDDLLTVEPDASPADCPGGTISTSTSNAVFPSADGGPGNDTMTGGPFADTMDGGSGDDHVDGALGDDIVKGSAGRDTLLGSGGGDVLSGGDGNDTLSGGTGVDTLAGGAGNDTMEGNGGDDTFAQDVTGAPDGADAMAGGSGTDTADYGRRTGPLTVSVANPADGDGASGEGDDVKGDVEHVIGGQAGDRLAGSAAAETLDGGPGADVIDGGAGADALNAGPGADTVVAVDGVQDTVSCGPDADVAVLDLKDTLVVGSIVTRFGTLRLVDCEQVTRQAVDDSPPGRPAGRALAVAAGGATVRFTCPRTARPGCRGTLAVRDAATRRVLGRARYALALGATAPIRVPLSAAEVRGLRRTRLAVVRTVERGHSRVGPRGAEFRLRVAG